MTTKYTIRDIAKMAGVSKGTVDRVIHQRGKVSETALNKVNAILDGIEFKPNLIAKNLKNNKMYHICVLLPDPDKDSYWEPCLSGVNDVITELGVFGISVETVFFDPTNTKSFLDANLAVQKTNPDAVLLVPLFFKEAGIVMQQYDSLGIGVSMFNNTIESAAVKSFIGQDLHQSGRVAAKLLHSIMQKGDVAILHIDEKYKNAMFMQKKEKGFKSFFNELPDSDHSVLKCKLKHPDFESVLSNFLDEHPKLTGIFVTTSKTYQVADFLQNKKHKHISLVGYDLLNENVAHLKKGTIDFLIHQNPKQQAYFGLKFIVEHFLFEKEIPAQLLLPIDIVNSENVAPFMRD
jgi:LacI family transcriptional regulator